MAITMINVVHQQLVHPEVAVFTLNYFPFECIKVIMYMAVDNDKLSGAPVRGKLGSQPTEQHQHICWVRSHQNFHRDRKAIMGSMNSDIVYTYAWNLVYMKFLRHLVYLWVVSWSYKMFLSSEKMLFTNSLPWSLMITDAHPNLFWSEHGIITLADSLRIL